MSLFNAPLSWCNSLAKTKVRVFFWSLFQFGFVTWALYILYTLSMPTSERSFEGFGNFLLHGNLLFFIGVGFPTLYLIAIYKLLRMKIENEQS